MLIFFRILQFILFYGGCAYLCYTPFKDKLRMEPRRLITALILLLSCIMAVYIGLTILEADFYAHFWFLAALPVCGGFYLFTINDSVYKSVLVLLLVGCYAAFVCGCSAFTSNLIFDKGLNYELLYTITFLFIGGATYLFIYEFTEKKLVPIINMIKSSELQSVYFMPLFYIILQAVFFTFYDTMGQMSDIVYLAVLIALNVSTYFITADIIHILNNSIDKVRMREELSTAENLLELQKNQYASWVSQIEAVRRARHDLKHHIAMIQTFLDSDDKEGLQEHVRNFQRTLPEAAPMMLCKNMDLNAILLHYYDRARKEGIKLTLLANVDGDIAINSQDLAVVFGNCLENAFEACARMDDNAEKSVSLMAKPMGRGLAIVIDNTFDGHAVMENEVYLSSKRNHRAGIGMTSIKLVVEKYDGIVSFETKDGLFMTSIRLGGKTGSTEATEYGTEYRTE